MSQKMCFKSNFGAKNTYFEYKRSDKFWVQKYLWLKKNGVKKIGKKNLIQEEI